MSALPLKADIRERDWHVRFVPGADIGLLATAFGIKKPPTIAAIIHGFAQIRTI
jgi:hypothetical protein